MKRAHEVVTLYEALRSDGMSKRAARREITTRLGISDSRIRAYITETKSHAQPIMHPATAATTPSPAPRIVSKPTTDWHEALARLTRDKRYVSVAHVADVHFPLHDEKALKLAYELIARRKPDVVVVGSDTADFDVINRFGAHPDRSDTVADVLEEFSRYWMPHIDTLRSAAPDARIVWVMGNHEKRLLTYCYEEAPKLRRTVEAAYTDSITYGGRVLFPGFTREVEIGHLVVKHGDRTGQHPAKQMLEDMTFQVSVMAGHVHRPTFWTRRGRRYAVTAVTSGCLCELQPDYQEQRPTGHRHGIAFGLVDTQTPYVSIDNLVFTNVEGRCMVADGGELVDVA